MLISNTALKIGSIPEIKIYNVKMKTYHFFSNAMSWEAKIWHVESIAEKCFDTWGILKMAIIKFA